MKNVGKSIAVKGFEASQNHILYKIGYHVWNVASLSVWESPVSRTVRELLTHRRLKR